MREQPQRIQLQRGAHGKPHLGRIGSSLEFNLSHSGEIALLVVSGELEVGIDVEQVRPRRGEDYYRSWTCHEAQVKCLGLGLLEARRTSLESIAVRSIDVAPGYVAAVAARADELPPLKGWTFDAARPKAG